MRRSSEVDRREDEVTDLAQRLRDLIQSGDGVADDRLLSERTLTEQLEVSRRKLRQAMALLEHQGVIRIVPRSGTFVTMEAEPLGQRANKEEASNFQLMEARLGMEPVAARLASQVATRGDIIRIYEAMHLVEKKVGLRVAADNADTNFHLTIVHASHNPYLIGMMMMVEHLIREHYAPFRQKMLRDVRLSRAFLDQHEKIYLAVRGHDAQGAFQAAQEHIMFSIQSFRGLNQGPKGVR